MSVAERKPGSGSGRPDLCDGVVFPLCITTDYESAGGLRVTIRVVTLSGNRRCGVVRARVSCGAAPTYAYLGRQDLLVGRSQQPAYRTLLKATVCRACGLFSLSALAHSRSAWIILHEHVRSTCGPSSEASRHAWDTHLSQGVSLCERLWGGCTVHCWRGGRMGERARLMVQPVECHESD